MRLRVGAYCVIVDDDRRLLMSRWIEGPAPLWSMPGGGLEEGEDPADAAVREVYEETGYEVALGELLGIDSLVVPGERRLKPGDTLHALRIIFTASVTGGQLRHEVGGSSDRAAWIPLDELADLPQVGLVKIAVEMAGLDRRAPDAQEGEEDE